MTRTLKVVDAVHVGNVEVLELADGQTVLEAVAAYLRKTGRKESECIMRIDVREEQSKVVIVGTHLNVTPGPPVKMPARCDVIGEE